MSGNVEKYSGIAIHAFNVAEDCLYDAKDYGPNESAYADLITKAIENLRDARKLLFKIDRKEEE